MKTWLSLSLACGLLAAPAFGQSNTAVAKATSLAINGPITSEAADGLAKSLASLGPGMTLLVNSAGGDADAAMRVGRLIFERRVKIKVERVCAAVCALYILPAASSVTFATDAVPVFSQMPSPQLYALTEARASQPGLSPADKDRNTSQLTTLKKVMLAQDTYYRAIGIDPSRMYRTMDIWMDVNRVARAAGRSSQAIGLLPDLTFFKQCLGFRNVVWRSLSIDDSIRLAHIGRTPLAVIVGPDVYYEGAKISSQPVAC